MKYGGIHLFKTTGKVLASDPQYIQVFQPSVNNKGAAFLSYTYARPCYAFGDVSAPSEKWLAKYKDEIMICVVFEEGNPAIPMWIGYTPTTSISDVPEDFPNGYIKRTVNFFIRIDDEEGKLYIAHRNGTTLTQALVINKDTTILGKESSSKEKALLGDSSVSLLGDLIDAIQQIQVITPTSLGPSSSATPINAASFVAIKQRLNSLLSKSVKLD